MNIQFCAKFKNYDHTAENVQPHSYMQKVILYETENK